MEKKYTKKEIEQSIDMCKKHIVKIKTPSVIDGNLDGDIETIESSFFLHNLDLVYNKSKIEKEFILCAAIHFKNGAETTVEGVESGVIICGRRHGDCYAVLKGMIGDDVNFSTLPDRDSQGFLTSKNRYVDRKEAWKIAEENNQIKFGYEASNNGVDSELISENLY